MLHLVNSALDLLFPPFCQGCMREGSYLCIECQNKVEAPIHRCPVCNNRSPLGRVHENCSSSSPLSGLMVASDYKNHAVKNLIWHLKYNSVKDICEPLSVIIGDFLVNADLIDYFRESIVIPVPMHPARQRFRGFNQAAEVAKCLAKNLRFDYTPALVKIKKTVQQVDLERTERLESVKEAFALNPNYDSKQLAGRSVLLIDDVATTGATLSECAKILKPYNPAEIWGLVVARN